MFLSPILMAYFELFECLFQIFANGHLNKWTECDSCTSQCFSALQDIKLL